jgi:hypothetical protein
MTRDLRAGHTGHGCGVLFAAVVVAGCAAIPQEQRDLLAAPPDCVQADSQIAALEKIKPSGFKKVTTTAGLASPAGLAGMVLSRFGAGPLIA